MNRLNQMVTVGPGKERFSGPSVLARLHQGSLARAQTIEAARQAELDRKPDPISDLTSGEITTRKLRKWGVVAGGAATLVTLLAIGCKDGGGQAEVQTTSTQPPETPTAAATPTPEPSPAVTSTPEFPQLTNEQIKNSRDEMKAKFKAAYSVQLPNGVCTLDDLDPIIDVTYEELGTVIDYYNFAYGLAVLNSEVSGLINNPETSTPAAEELAKYIEFISMASIENHWSDKRLPPEELEGGKETWRGVSSSPSSFTSKDGCHISASDKA